VSLSSGVSRVMVEPAPIVAPAPTFTGATSIVPEPMNAPAPISVRHFVRAVVVAGDGAGADVDLLADGGIAEIGEVVGLGAAPEFRLLHLDEIADVHVLVEPRLGPQPRERAHDRTRADHARSMTQLG